ncbi:MAG: hypothetical protein ACFFE8_03940 [Candidatus Heimdallarchaeota archaeon]
MISQYVETKNRDKAQNRLKQFEELTKGSDLKIGKIFFSLTEALFLKTSSRIIDRAKAQEKYLDLLLLINEYFPKSGRQLPLFIQNFSFQVIFHLVELYLDEFKITRDEMIIKRARQLIEKQYDELKTDGSYFRNVELSILRAKLLAIDGEIDEALLTLQEAKNDAKNRGFSLQEKRIDSEIGKIKGEFEKWDTVIQSSSLKDRIDKLRVEEYLKETRELIQQHESW